MAIRNKLELLSFGPVNILARNGWTKDSLKVGDEVSVVANPAKDVRPIRPTRGLSSLATAEGCFAGSSASRCQQAAGIDCRALAWLMAY